MKRTITITYNWWRTDGQPVKPVHIEALEESAWKRIVDQMSLEYISGELYDNIHMTGDDPEDGVEYSGWWSVEKTETEAETKLDAAPQSLIEPETQK